MSLSSGSRLGVYEIVGPLGAGGMGEVYRARDTKLGREVAIKILPESFVQDAERLARFEREAKLLAALNHPGIATLYGLEESNGSPFLVMELVGGETLAERIARGAIPIDEALHLFKQIADALEAAHEKAIIHRDLKPPNIKITPEGNVKLLDFGLAKAFAGDEAPSGDGSQSPTLTKGTALGAILGTASYMSPEQARGKTVDKRTDVWAFGCCLYEAVTGRKAFEGETATDTISAVVRVEPRWDRLPADTPAAIRKLLRRSLTKERNERLADVADARLEIKEALETSETEWQVTASVRPLLPYVGIAVAATALVVGFSVWSVMRPGPSPPTRLVITLPNGQSLVERSTSPIALSPDGRRLVYAAETDEASQLYLRELHSFQTAPVAGTEGGHTPFFSPDGNWIGFFTDDALKKVAVGGGASTVLAPAENLSQGASWSRAGWIVYSPGLGGMMQVSQGGGIPKRLAERIGVYPQVLPDGDTTLYSWITGSDRGLALVSNSTGEGQDLEPPAVAGAVYLRSGHLLYPSSLSSLAALPFDLDRRTYRGEAITVVDSVLAGRDRQPYLAVSDSGTLAIVSGEDRTIPVVLVDRDGQAVPLVRHPLVHTPRFSPDGRQVAYDTQPDIWIYDLERDTRTRLTVDLGQVPAWSPDGRRIAFHSRGNLYWMPADGSSDADVLFATVDSDPQDPSWSFDGQLLAFAQINPDTGPDIWILPIGEEPIPFLVTPADERAPRFSPDDRFIVYQSNESGEKEIYVRPFPDADGKWKISADGGTEPVWSRDGGELFYRHGRDLMVVDVDVESGDRFNIGRPRTLFSGDFREDRTGHASYDVSPDGQSFVMLQESRDEPLTEIHIVLNWFDELERLVPTN